MSGLQVPEVRAKLDRLHAAAAEDPPAIATGFLRAFGRGIEPRYFANACIAIGPEQGRLLYALAVTAKARGIVEFGTSFGISTIYLAAAAREWGGHVITTEIEPEKCRVARGNLADAGLSSVVTVLEGDAEATLPTTSGQIDLLFLDAWSRHYVPLLRLLAPRFRPGTLIIRDNAGRGEASGYVPFIADRPESFVRSLLKVAGRPTEVVIYLGASKDLPPERDNP